jgi:hypothetical protein
MKNLAVVSLLFVTMILSSCLDSETEILKQARITQQGILSKQSALIGDLDKEIAAAEQEISKLTQTPEDAAAGVQRISELQERIFMINSLKDQVVNYKLNLKEIPEAAAIKEDAFFKGMKDEQLLKLVKEQDSAFSVLKSEIETELL